MTAAALDALALAGGLAVLAFAWRSRAVLAFAAAAGGLASAGAATAVGTDAQALILAAGLQAIAVLLIVVGRLVWRLLDDEGE